MDDSVVTAPPWPVNLLTPLLRRRPFGSRVHMIDQRRSDRDAFLKRQHGTEWVKPQMKVWLMVVSFFAKHPTRSPGVFVPVKPVTVAWNWGCEHPPSSTYSPGRASQKQTRQPRIPGLGGSRMMSFEVSSSQSRHSPDTRQMDGIFDDFCRIGTSILRKAFLKGSQHVKKPWLKQHRFSLPIDDACLICSEEPIHPVML